MLTREVIDMLATIALLTVTVYAALAFLAMRDRRGGRRGVHSETREEVTRNRDLTLKRRRGFRGRPIDSDGEAAAGRPSAALEDRTERIREIRRRSPDDVRQTAAAREDGTELIPEIRRRSPDDVRQMVRWAINAHRPPFRNN
jgi:hypothetical protein